MSDAELPEPNLPGLARVPKGPSLHMWETLTYAQLLGATVSKSPSLHRGVEGHSPFFVVGCTVTNTVHNRLLALRFRTAGAPEWG